MFKVFITRKIPEAGIKLLKQKKYQVKVSPYDRVLRKDELIKFANGADALLCLLTDKIDAEVLDGIGPQLKIVANYAVGLDNIDLKVCKERKIYVTNTPGVLTQAVAEHTFALMLSIARRIVESDKFVRTGKFKGWAPLLFLGSDIAGKTLGVIGLGRIGQAVCERAALGMRMKILYNDIKRQKDFEKEVKAKFVDIKTILKTSDFISLHVPLLPSTRHLIGEKELKLMKKTAYLINTSRGPVVDEKALVIALKNKWLAGAALDVYEFEPKLAAGLSKLENVILTPHTASATLETRQAMAKIAAQNIIAALNHKTPPNLVK